LEWGFLFVERWVDLGMIRYISLLLFIGLAFWGCEDADSAGRDSDVVGIWDISNFTINNTSHIYGNNIMLTVENIYTYLMDGTDWNFQEDGEIIIDFVTLFMPEGTGETMSGNWVTSDGDIQITFEVPSIQVPDTIDIDNYTETYFNDILFQYEISGQNMTLIAGDTVVVFQKK